MSGRFRGTMSTPDVTRVRSDGSTQTESVTDSLEDKLRSRAAKATAYEKYKAQLNEYFDGKRALPQQLKDMLATRPGAEEHGFVQEEADAELEPDDGGGKKKKRKKGPPEKAAPGTRRRIGGSSDARLQHIAALRASTSPREAELAIDGMRAAGFSLPLEMDLLSKALGHKDQDVVAEALRGLVQIVTASPETKGASLLKGRVANAALLASSSEVRQLCSELQAALS